MKTSIKFALFIAILTIFSCSKNDEPVAQSTANTLVLPKKITEVSNQGGTLNTYVNTFVFENNVLKSTSYGTDRRYDFVYNGDKVVEMKKYVAGVASGSTVFNYIGDNLNYVLNASESTKTKYTYNGNTLSRITYISINGTTETIEENDDITFNSSNNVSQLLGTSFFNGNTYTHKETYLYDSKNTPLTNFNKYLKLLNGVSGLSINNQISNKQYSLSTNTTPSSQNSCSITYNSNNYPIKIVKTDSSNGTMISETTIEYY
jgi:hypothetical protein